MLNTPQQWRCSKLGWKSEVARFAILAQKSDLTLTLAGYISGLAGPRIIGVGLFAPYVAWLSYKRSSAIIPSQIPEPRPKKCREVTPKVTSLFV